MAEEFTGENADLNEVKARRNAKSNDVPLEMEYEFVPNNPYSLTVDAPGLGQSHVLEGEKYKPGFWETFVEEAKEFNVTSTGLHSAKGQLENPSLSNLSKPRIPFSKLPGLSFLEQYENQSSPFQDIAPPGWNPKKDPAKLVNIQPQYLQYAMEATGPKDLEYRIQRIFEEQHHDEVLANGSTVAKIMGGLTGIVTDPMSYVPIAAIAKYGKVGSSFFKNAARALPGAATYAVVQSATDQANKINGNMQDFVTNAAINSTFGSALFGVAGVAGLTVEKMNLWNLRGLAKEYIDGVDFKLKMDEKGKITGIEASGDFSGGGSGGAAKVKFAQDLADSTFAKSGLFKVPYVGTGLYHIMTMPILGTPLPKLLNHHYKTVRGIVDRFVDHNILTTGILKGEVAPVKFETLMLQEYSALRLMDAQISALHLERNGFDISSRIGQSAVNLGLTIKNKGVELLGKELDKEAYVSKEAFYDEVTTVLRTRESSQHPAVNEAARMFREKIDNTYKQWRKAYNLPEDWIPQNVLEDYVMRVYDTPYMNTNENKWVEVISNFLKESDEIITARMKPIHDVEIEIAKHRVQHEEFIRSGMANEQTQRKFVEVSDALKIRKKVLEETLQNELRDNPEMFYHVDDWNALSAKEAKEINILTKNRDSLVKEIESQKKEIAKIKEESSSSKGQATKAKTSETAKKQLKRSDTGKLVLEKQEVKLRELEEKLHKEEVLIQEKLQSGEVNPRLYYKEKDRPIYKLKDPSNRLKFRKTYLQHPDALLSGANLEEGAHFLRQQHAKGAYDTILNQTAEDTINQVMGKITGNAAENHLKSRTLLVPDRILYENNFMSKDLMAKTSNYVTYLSRRAHLKNIFNDVTLDGGFEPVLENLTNEHFYNRGLLNDKKKSLKEKLEKQKTTKGKKKIEKEIAKVDKAIVKERKQFENGKKVVNHLYEKMMGLKKQDRLAKQVQSGIMSTTATAMLSMVPFTMVSDLGAQGLQHGIWPFIRDGVYPIVQSLGGILKTKDSEALRRTAPNLALAIQDVLRGYQDKNWSMHTEPYLNLGKFVGGLENIAHFSSNITLTNYFDNGLQRIAGALSQGEFMRILHAFKAGTMTEKEGLYLRQYGLDYEKWADRILAAFKADGGGKTKIGGYQSLFWQWQDLEAANHFSHAVFRGIKATAIQRGLADSPFWADNLLGSLVNGFNGWTYASLNRYVIPSMQKADAETLMGVVFMLSTGYFVTPLRRIARGEEPFPENETDAQRMYQTINDSGYFSFFAKVLNDANVLSGDRILGDLKNDKYRDRTRVGLLGPAFGQANRMADVIGAAAFGEMNKKDLKTMARMIPIVNSSWTWWMSKRLIEGLEIPETRTQAKAQKNF